MTSDYVVARRKRASTALIAVCAFLHVVGLAGLYVVPAFFSRDTYVSENALQPGIHGVSFAKSQEFTRITHVSNQANASSNKASWVFQQLQEANLEAHLVEGCVAGVLRSPRGTASSAVALSTHFDVRRKHSGLSVVLSLAQHFARSPVALNKDLWFLFCPNASHIERFLTVYYEPVSPSHRFRRSGPLQQALQIDLAFDRGVRKVIFQTEGDFLPNLDVLNTAVRTCSETGSIKRSAFASSQRLVHPWLSRLPHGKATFFLNFFIIQAFGTGVTTLSHGPFNRHSCDALTISHSLVGVDSSSIEVDASSMVSCIEGTLRSLLSLQESLHQSYYFYLLPSPSSFVTIGDYMIVFGLCALILPVTMLHLAYFHVDWNTVGEADVFPAFLCGISAALLPVAKSFVSVEALVGLYYLFCILSAFLVSSRLSAQSRASTLGLGLLLVTVFSGICSVTNFPLSILACVYAALQLLFYVTGSKIILLAVDPVLVALALAHGEWHFVQMIFSWASFLGVAVPFRLALLMS